MKNEDRFTGKAEIYQKFRPTYPKDYIDYLYSQAGFNTETKIADIGSGTGIFSRLLIERGSLVYCVEPNEDMRQIAEKTLSGFKNFISVSATAENTKLQSESVDFITAAQAAHWFDGEMFKSECRRILKQSGKVAMVWNIRDYESEMIKREYSIREKYCIDKKGLGEGGGPPKDMVDFFADRDYEMKIFRNDLQFDRETFVGRNLSSSYAPKKETQKYHEFVSELNDFFDGHSTNGILNFPHFTQSFIGRV